MSKLSPDTVCLIDALYPDNRHYVYELLEDNLSPEQIGCNDWSPEQIDCNDWSPEQMERIYFSVIKLGQKSIAKLEQAKNLAITDWRDLIMSAGFGEDVDAHRTWWKSII